MKQSKNYIGFVNDHSGSMTDLADAATKDYNATIKAVKEAATREELDTVVSVVAVGYPGGAQTTRQVVVSNPHVLKPVTSWPCPGGTPLYDGIADMINLLATLPDANDPSVSFLLLITTDGEECSSRLYGAQKLKMLMQSVNMAGNWTFAFRVPKKGDIQMILDLGVPAENIQFWDTTVAGMAKSTVETTAAVDGYFRSRSTGVRSSSAFFADASKVNVAALTDITNKLSLYVVPPADEGIQIRDFILRHRMDYLKGAAFYQLTKTESRVSHTKQVLVRDRATGKIFGGAEARQMIGLPTNANARLHPGDHKNFDLFIQSESVNRKLVGGTGVIYWKEIGVPFTEADLAYLLPKAAAPAVPPVVQLPAVAPTNKPTKSPIPVTPQFRYYETREDARRECANYGITQSSILRTPTAMKGKKWSIPSSLFKLAPATAKA